MGLAGGVRAAEGKVGEPAQERSAEGSRGKHAHAATEARVGTASFAFLLISESGRTKKARGGDRWDVILQCFPSCPGLSGICVWLSRLCHLHLSQKPRRPCLGSLILAHQAAVHSVLVHP